MSKTLLGFAESFVSERLSADVFVEAYQELWRIERDSHTLRQDDRALSECLSTLFCLADQYNPQTDRDEDEFDEERLRTKVMNLMELYRGGRLGL